ncbi:MAG: glycosyltransferase family 2 protein [Actinobacteria bacterium]|nr:MAG: glycosyltransferase family 2 protein [Actinomycetota bacterium]RIK02891.1 MAG: hypothetical protein DCC48_17485 [Acidobacteriota bacterium]
MIQFPVDDPLPDTVMPADQRTEPRILFVHRAVPGPAAPDARDRQAFNRVVDLRCLGFDVSVLALEVVPGGGSDLALSSVGVDVLAWTPSPAIWITEHAEDFDLVYCSTILSSVALERALANAAPPLVLDMDVLPSAEKEASREGLATRDTGGLATFVDHQRRREAPLLSAAEAVLCTSAVAVEQISAAGHHAATVVVPATAPLVPVRFRALQREALVHIGHWSSDVASPDEAGLALILDEILPLLGVEASTMRVLSEDAVPRQRRLTQWKLGLLPLDKGLGVFDDARLVLNVRPHGAPTPARIVDLSSRGLPFVATPAAVGSLDLGEVADTLVAGEADQLAKKGRALLDDPSLWHDTSGALQHLAGDNQPAAVRPVLCRALSDAGIALPSSPIELTVAAPTDAEFTPTGGTMAAVDPRIEQLERAMVPAWQWNRDAQVALQQPLGRQEAYRLWAAAYASPTGRQRVDDLEYRPLISILMPTYNTDPKVLGEAIDSVLAQSYPHWELCIADDASGDDDTLRVLHAYREVDSRLRIVIADRNEGIAGASNQALALASGEWVGLLDHDDELKPDALYWVVELLNRCPEYDMVYSDEDKLDAEGELWDPFFKPDWSPDLLLSVNYIAHFTVIRRALMLAVGGFGEDVDGSQDYDLFLKVTELTDRIGHISRPLYSWRVVPGSTASDIEAKPQADTAGKRALRSAIERRGLHASVSSGVTATRYRVRYEIDKRQELSIVIPTRDGVELLQTCIDSVRDSAGGIDHEIVVIDNQSSDPATLAYLDRLDREQWGRVIRYSHEFSFSRQMNLGALCAAGELILILNNDTVVRTADWLEAMMEHAQRPEVGAVGARLVFPDGRAQHEGIVLGMGGPAYNLDTGHYMELGAYVRDCAAVTAACVMMRATAFWAVGGLDERLRVAFNDVDLGMRLSERGFRVVYTPYAELEHDESASRKTLHPADDSAFFAWRWGDPMDVRDPFISPNLEWLNPFYMRF